MEQPKPLRAARPCAICGKARVDKDKVCDSCKSIWGVRLEEPWALEMLKMSDEQASLVRRKKAHEAPLTNL